MPTRGERRPESDESSVGRIVWFGTWILLTVREIQPWLNGDYVALVVDGEKLRISRRYREAILRRVL